MKFVQFEIEKMKEKLKNDMCSLIYINYEKEKGIKVFGNEENVLNLLTEEDLKDFYKIYIFNKDTMKTVYKFSDDDYRVSEINYIYEQNDKGEKIISNYDIIREREIYSEIYLDKTEHEKEAKKKEFKVKVQIIQKKSEEKTINRENELVKFVEFIDL